ncbi:polyketide synthase dehydratase domain-containing protein, partial [Dactylosporangium sucinum]|uniref:polyketide synthase dehydratase domain-containing protein n=1 Tax=Dactylosporangium sucinum TaxID=1424081 RepID=UPI00357158DE
MQLQLVAGPAGPDGTRDLGIHARAGDDGDWNRHATGLVAPAPGHGPAADEDDLAVWPPSGARAVAFGDLYDRLAARGVAYGPAFLGLHRVWHRGGDVFAEVALPDGVQGAGYGLHPVLLDAALQAWQTRDDERGAEVRMPFEWSGVSLHRSGAARLRVRIHATADGGIGILAADETGAPVLTVGSMVQRPVTGDQLRVADRSLFRVAWSPWTGIGGSAG